MVAALGEPHRNDTSQMLLSRCSLDCLLQNISLVATPEPTTAVLCFLEVINKLFDLEEGKVNSSWVIHE